MLRGVFHATHRARYTQRHRDNKLNPAGMGGVSRWFQLRVGLGAGKGGVLHGGNIIRTHVRSHICSKKYLFFFFLQNVNNLPE